MVGCNFVKCSSDVLNINVSKLQQIFENLYRARLHIHKRYGHFGGSTFIQPIRAI